MIARAPVRAGVAVALALGLAVGLAACGGGGDDDRARDPDAGPTAETCEGSDQAFVRATLLAVRGRRARSNAEVRVYADLMAAVRARDAAAPDGGPLAALDPREVAARAIVATSTGAAYLDRWSEHVMDALRVARIEQQSQAACYGVAARDDADGVADGALAAHVRDAAPTDGGAPGGRFTMRDLLRSSLALDDLSVVYRAHLFALVARPIPAANVAPLEAELARREDFGLVFDAAYLNRDLVCLGCHNSEASVTDRDDPALDRHFPIAARLERAVYGATSGIEPARAHAAFRVADVVRDDDAPGGVMPWGLSPSCGRFDAGPPPPDPAAIDGKLASVTGDRATVFDLERALARGVDGLHAAGGLATAADGTVADPDQALAYLVAMSLAESVWREVVGTPLTIANYFPRNAAAQGELRRLADVVVASRFSLRELLVAIATSPHVGRRAPADGCGGEAYPMPPIFDPWTTSDEDPARRGNGPGDGLVPLGARTLLGAAFAALDWPRPSSWDFPEDALGDFCVEFYGCREMAELCAEEQACCVAYEQNCTGDAAWAPDEIEELQRGTGVFLKNGERGFRGLDFQARLVWEDVFGACRNPGEGADFVAALVARARATPGATVGDVVAALKDRLTGEARVDSVPFTPGGASEAAGIEAVIGASLAAPVDAAPDLEAGARALCGVLLATPQFMMSGLPAPDAAGVPRLTAPADGYAAVCAELAAAALPDGLAVACDDHDLALASP